MEVLTKSRVSLHEGDKPEQTCGNPMTEASTFVGGRTNLLGAEL